MFNDSHHIASFNIVSLLSIRRDRLCRADLLIIAGRVNNLEEIITTLVAQTERQVLKTIKTTIRLYMLPTNPFTKIVKIELLKRSAGRSVSPVRIR